MAFIDQAAVDIKRKLQRLDGLQVAEGLSMLKNDCVGYGKKEPVCRNEREEILLRKDYTGHCSK